MDKNKILQLEGEIRNLKKELTRTKAEEQSAKERLQTLGDNIPNCALYSFVFDKKTDKRHLSYASANYEQLTGVPVEAAMIDINAFFDKVHPEDLPEMMQKFNDSAQTITVFDCQHRIIVNGQIRWLRRLSRPHCEGEMIIWYGIIIDITERKNDEAELTKYRERLESLVNERTNELLTSNEELNSVIEELNTVNNELKRYQSQLEEMVDEKAKELTASNERLTILTDNIPNCALYRFVYDEEKDEKRLSYASANYEIITGIPVKSAIANINAFYEKVHPEDFSGMMQKFYESAGTLTTFDCEHRIIVNGQIRWIRRLAQPRRENELIVWEGIIIDITQRKIIETELLKNREHLESLVHERTLEMEAEKNRLTMLGDNLPGGTLFQLLSESLTEQMHMAYVSATWESVTGIPADLVLYDISNFFDKVDPNDLSALIESIEESGRTMSDFSFETILGGNRSIYIVSRPRKNNQYTIWDGIISNITEKKGADHELETEKNRLKMLGDKIPSGSLFQFVRDVLTRQIRLTYVSTTWETVTGIPADVSLTDVSKVLSTIPPNEFTVFMKNIEESAKTMCDFIIEIHFDERWMQIISRPRMEGTMIVWDGIITDITERKTYEAELAQYRANLKFLMNDETAARAAATKKADESEMMMTNYFMQTHEGITILDSEGKVRAWNLELERITKIKYNDALGKYIWDIYKRLIPKDINHDIIIDNCRKTVLTLLDANENESALNNELELVFNRTRKKPLNVIISSFRIAMSDDKYYIGQIVREVAHHKVRNHK